jgi:hypothetical protein
MAGARNVQMAVYNDLGIKPCMPIGGPGGPAPARKLRES